MNKVDKIKVGISIGDLNGIGVEVILKTFEDKRMLELCTPVIFGSTKTIGYHKKKLKSNIPINGVDTVKKLVNNKINLLNVWKENVDIDFGKATEVSGKYAFQSLERATEALKNGDIDVLITAPINKKNIQSDKFQFQGHTEYLESQLNGNSLMILMTDELRMGLITGHIPISDVAKTITPELIKDKVEVMNQSLKMDFGIRKPKIAILGLNPHCGDQGVIGKEDEKIVAPAIKKILDSGILAFGPYSADGFFGSGLYKDFDGVLAMYHDQGLAPFKALSFGKGVNFTAGLDKIRTSPDHGTAYEIAGQNKANHLSFRESVYSAIDIFKNRNLNKKLQENKLEDKVKE